MQRCFLVGAQFGLLRLHDPLERKNGFDRGLSRVDALRNLVDEGENTIEGTVIDDQIGIDCLAPDIDQDRHRSARQLFADQTPDIGIETIETRRAEGERIGAVIAQRVEEIAFLADTARAHPSLARGAILTRLRDQVTALMDTDKGLSAERLHQEAMLLATRADIAEELDRFSAHVTAARDLLGKGGPIGRKLDFLSQEFNREANTLCSKSNDVSLTAIGLDLKATIDQLREQVQNLE